MPLLNFTLRLGCSSVGRLSPSVPERPGWPPTASDNEVSFKPKSAFQAVCLPVTVCPFFPHSVRGYIFIEHPLWGKSLTIKLWTRHVPSPNLKQVPYVITPVKWRGVSSIVSKCRGFHWKNWPEKWVCGWKLQEGLKCILVTHLAALRNYEWFQCFHGRRVHYSTLGNTPVDKACCNCM